MERLLRRMTHEIHNFSGAGGACAAFFVLIWCEEEMAATGGHFLVGCTFTYFASVGIVKGSSLLFYCALRFYGRKDQLKPWNRYWQMHLEKLQDSPLFYRTPNRIFPLADTISMTSKSMNQHGTLD